MRTHLYTAILGMLIATPVVAQPLSQWPGQQEAIKQIIKEQFLALRRDDADTAFVFASPGIRAKFGTPEKFMEMVQRTYAPLYQSNRLTFGDLRVAGTYLFQMVYVVAADGQEYTAAYEMIRSSEGLWQVNGCALIPPN